jgi:hypothetical protein
MEKRQPFQQMLLGKVVSAYRKLKLDPGLSSLTSINSEWIRDFNIRPKTLQLLYKRAGNTLEAISIGKDFLSRTPAAQQLRKRMGKWDCMKLKSFCTTKEMVSNLKRPCSEWEKIFAIFSSSDKELITRIYRELKILTPPKFMSQ